LKIEVIESCAREQRRIAYDLHDGVGQQLVGIALSAKLLEQELRAEHPAQAKKASAIVRLANETLREKPSGSRIGVESLSDREMQVFQLLGASYSAREIAEQFHLSRKTVETHCEEIECKLSLHNMAELKQFARKWAAENLTPAEPWTAPGSDESRSKS